MFPPRVTAEEEPDVASLPVETLSSLPLSPLPVCLSLFLSLFRSFSFPLQYIGKPVQARFPFNRHFFLPFFPLPLLGGEFQASPEGGCCFFEACVLASGHDWRKSERNSDDSFRLLSRVRWYTCHRGQKSIVLRLADMHLHMQESRVHRVYKISAALIWRKVASTTTTLAASTQVPSSLFSRAEYGKSTRPCSFYFTFPFSLFSFVPLPTPFYHVLMTRVSSQSSLHRASNELRYSDRCSADRRTFFKFRRLFLFLLFLFTRNLTVLRNSVNLRRLRCFSNNAVWEESEVRWNFIDRSP